MNMSVFIWIVTIGFACAVHIFDNSVKVTTKTSNLTNTDDLEKNGSRGMRVEESELQVEHIEYLVVTEQGRVRGIRDDNRIIGFFDIPYGHFHEGNPFQEPSPPESWDAVLEKTEHTSRCPQIDSNNIYVGSHECLTLSIFKPENAENADVLFHIHDITSNSGSGDPSKYGPQYLVPQGIILVLPNYRIGPLGFLCLQNETIPGNAGLKDLTLALQWTMKNIKTFGGNDSNIVVSGSGIAGALVEYLLLSNSSRTFISKGITESGFVLSPWAIDRHPLETAKRLMEELEKTESNDETDVYNIFDGINLEKLTRAAQNLNLRPCIESNTGFINESPWYLLNHEKLAITVMSGSANQAAMEMTLGHTEESLSKINTDFSLLLPNDLKFHNIEEKETIARQVRTQYFGENNITINDMERLSQCYSDGEYLYPGIRGARLLVKGGATVYFYEFSYGSQHPVNGSARGDSLNYVFSRDGAISENTVDNRLKDIMSHLWISFIKTGKPSAENIEWNNLEVSTETGEVWLSIGNEVLVQKGFHDNRLKLWDEIYENHFIEHNMALKLNCSIYITLLGSIILLDIRSHFKL